MVYKNIIRIFDERKRKLEILMDDESLGLSVERMNQIKGAVGEIDLFLQTLRQHQDQKVHRNFCYTTQLQSQNKGFFGRILRPSTRDFSMSEEMTK